jgi:hypothetical protein
LNRIDAGKQLSLATRGLIEWMTRERQKEAVELSHPANTGKMRWEIWKGVEKEMHPEWRSVNAQNMRLMEAVRMDNAGLDFMIQTLGETDHECRLCRTKKQARCIGCHMLTLNMWHC